MAIAVAMASAYLVENEPRGEAGTVLSAMPPIQRHTAGNGGGAYNPLTADPWARARTRP
jgi:hypothetical protein